MSTEIRLDARLSAIMDYVRPGSVVADIGTDHGYLICQLVKSGLAKRGFACDANSKPLDRAGRTIRDNCLSLSIDTVLTDGLDDLPYWLIDTIVIAGMGGDLIARILLRHPWTRDSHFRFILQPMTKAENLRQSLFENGFIISSESVVICDNKVYSVMCVSYTDRSFEYANIDYYIGCLPERSDLPARLYLERVASRLETKADGLRRSKDPDKAGEYAELAREIRRRIERMETHDLSGRRLL